MKRSWILLCAALVAGCSDGTLPPPVPGDHAPGDSCSAAQDCGCWSCTCEGIGGDPGEAQLCTGDGHCPTGEEACAASCSLANAKVAKATPLDTCPGRP